MHESFVKRVPMTKLTSPCLILKFPPQIKSMFNLNLNLGLLDLSQTYINNFLTLSRLLRFFIIIFFF